MRLRTWKGGALGAAALGLALGGCNYITGGDQNPNVVNQPTVDQLFTAIQVNTFAYAESQLARITGIWTQQLAGLDRQFLSLDVYQIDETTADFEFSLAYEGGGLLDIRKARTLATDAHFTVYPAILKIHEAYLIGEHASIFGDIPYTQAAQPLEFRQPALDKQEAVYASIQTLLGEAVTALNAGYAATGAGNAEKAALGASDMNFGGSAARWARVANTMRARFYIHWAEAQRSANAESKAAAVVACGGDCIQKAIDAAKNGINTAAGDWSTIHGSAATTANLWYQFNSDRGGYMGAGALMVDSLAARSDPRLEVFYTQGLDEEGDDAYIGSHPGEAYPDASVPNVASETSIAIASCAENQFILGEAYYYQGKTAEAQAALAAGVACESAKYSATIPTNTALTGAALFHEIMMQKYFAQFLNIETYNDYKRTCQPALLSTADVDASDLPRRLFYGQTERQSNTSIPVPNSQPAFNRNDPNGC
jgi:hypothetical protein